MFSYSIADSETGEVLEQIGVPIPYNHLMDLKLN